MVAVPGIAKVVTKIKFGQDDGDAAYWQAQSPETRLAALEEIRREYHLWKYGGEPPFRKVVTIIKMDGEVIRRWGEDAPDSDSSEARHVEENTGIWDRTGR